MTFSDPQRNIDQLGLSEGMTIADFGAGSGFYTRAAAQRVGTAGRVYAIDVQDGLLARIHDTAQSDGLHNVEVVHGDLEHSGGSKLADMSVDVVIVANILFQIGQKEALVHEVIRVLKPNGRVLLVEWSDTFGGIGPEASRIVSEMTATDLFTQAGCVVAQRIQAGAHHYGLVLRKTK